MLSHELRNPLEPIRNSLFVLDRAAPGGEQSRRAQNVIDRQVAQLTRLVDDLLDVTRISRGKVRLQLESLDFAQVARRAVEDRRGSVPQTRDRAFALASRRAGPDSRRPGAHRAGDGQSPHERREVHAAGRTRSTVTVEVDEQSHQAVARVHDTGLGIARRCCRGSSRCSRKARRAGPRQREVSAWG